MKSLCKKNILIAYLICLTLVSNGQDIIEVTTQVFPPYTSEFTTFHTKTMVTVRNTTTQRQVITLTGTLTGDNGIQITFPVNQPSPITLAPQQVLPVNAGQLQPYFAESNIQVQGISIDELYRGNGLPTGNYDLCFRAVAYQGRNFLSLPPPQGCAGFIIQQVISENSVRLSVQAIPPYSTYLSDYFDKANKVLVMLQNTTSSTLDLRFRGAITGDNGISIKIPDNYIPNRAIHLSPRQTLQLTGLDLREYFNENIIELTGIDRNELLRGNGLPEGNYQLCLQAIEIKSGNPLSPPEPTGCAYFDIRQFEPPFVIQPACGTSAQALNPQNLLFSWSVPAGVRPDQVEYILKIVEMYPQEIDPNQAMMSANRPPLFEKVIRSNSYVYSLADPVLENGKKYAFRVTIRTNSQTGRRRAAPANFRNEGHSEVCYFTYGKDQTTVSSRPQILDSEGSGEQVVVFVDLEEVLTTPTPQTNMSPDPEDSQDCIANCDVPAPTNTSQISIGPGDEVQIGKFTMTVSTGNSTSGTGVINVNFLRTPINVVFNNLQVNTDYQAFGSSTVAAVTDGGIPENHPVLTTQTPNPNFNESDLSFIRQLAQNNNRRVSLFPENNSESIGMPISLDYGNFDLIILGLIFTPTNASMNAMTSVELLNSTTNDDLLMMSTSICIRPNGFGEPGEVALMNDKEVPLSNHVSLIFNQNTTKASFDCQGIEDLELDGTLEFDRDVLIPVNNDGEAINGEVAAAFNTTITDFNDWTLSISSLNHAFTIPELIGFKFEASDITFDHSSTSNPDGANNAFPANYPGSGNVWTGLYIGSVAVSLPASLKDNNSTIGFSVNHVLLDKNGFSGDIDPQVSILPNGQLGGWDFSITDFDLMIHSSSLIGAGMNGTLGLPISTDNLDYEVAIETSSSETDEVDFNFQMSTNQSVDVDMWFAELDLDATSTISIDKEGPIYRPEAILSGDLTISWSPGDAYKPGSGTNAVSNINIPQLRIENLTITGGEDPSISLGGVGLDNYDNNQAALARFPLVLNSVMLNGLNSSDIQLQMDLELSLNAEGNGISGGTVFSIVGEFSDGHYNYDHTELNEVSIDVDLGVAHVDGSIAIFTNDATFGDGFRGEISAHINAINVGFDATMQVGKTLGGDGYRYWYFDLMASLGPTGIPIPGTAAAIYGIGGGAYHNMTRNDMQEMLYDEFDSSPTYDDTPGSSVYGTAFTPNQGNFGFNASLAFGLVGARSAFNGDVKFGMELEQDGSVDNVIIEGGGYVMQDFTGNRDDAFIKGSMLIVIVPHDEAKPFPTPVFHLETPDPFTIDIASVVKGQIPLAMHFDPQTWYVKLGEWENYDEPWNDDKRIELAVDLKIFEVAFYGYFMMGNDIPEIPPMPAVVRNAFGMPEVVTPRNDVLGGNNSGGVAFGSGYHFGTDPRLKFLIFYADIMFTTGFDVTLKHYQGDQGCGDGFGIHGWYAKGQMYAFLDVDVGLEVNVWFTDGKLKLSLLQATAAAAMQAQLPNPTWVKGQFAISGSVLNGLIKVNTSFKFELGEKCLPDSGNPFDDMPIIAEVIPGNGENQVSVFTNPEIAFNFPNEEFDVEEIKDDGSTVVRTFYYTFESFKLKYKDEEGNNKTMDISNWKKYRQDGNSAVFVSSDILPPDTQLSYEIRVRGWEKVIGSDKLLVTEQKEGTFHTGQFPDHIYFSHIINSIPGYRQRYFLKDEYQQGEINLKYDYSEHFDPEFWYEDVWELGNYVNPAVSGSFQWKARFKELATGNVYERNCSINGNGTKITFNIPNGLKNHAIYKLDLVVVFNPPVNAFTLAPEIESNTYASYKDVVISGGGGGGGSVLGGMETVATAQGNTSPQGTAIVPSQNKQLVLMPGSDQQMVAANYQLAQQADPGGIQDYIQKYNGPNQVYLASLNKGMLANPADVGQPTGGVSIQRMNRKLLESTESSKEAEHNLFKFFFAFKDSKFNTKEQKLNTVHALYPAEDDVPVKNYSTLYPDVDVSTDVPFILLEFDENFDRYEIFGKEWGNSDYGGFIEPVYNLAYDYSSDDYSLDDFMNDLYEMPDYEEWQEIDVYDVNSLEPGGYPVEFGVEKPLPDWEDYLPGYDEWDPHRHEDKWHPFGKRDFPTAFQMMSEIFGEPTLTFYKGAVKHGSVDWKGENVVLPDGLLSAEEVLGAMDAAPDPPSGDLQQFQANVGFEPPTFGEPQYTAPTQPGRLAIIDYMEWLMMRDYYIFKKHIHDMNVEILGSPNQYNTDYNEYYDLYFIPIESYLEFDMYYKNRPGGEYSFKLEEDYLPYPVPELNEDGGYTNDY